MIQKIELLLFMLSLVYSVKHLLLFIFNLNEATPKPIKLTPLNEALLYISIAYFFTYIISLFIK